MTSTAITRIASRTLPLLFVTAYFSLQAIAQGIAATPPMGWNSWNHFAGKVTDADVRAAADALVSTGMRDAGYIYVNIDDTWEDKRGADGVLRTNSKFPDLKALADYVHGKGLKLGIYSSPGPFTCAHYEGSYGHEEQDAKMYASWGIDYLKYDLCGFRDIMRKEAGDDRGAKAFAMQKAAYKKMHEALAATGRPIVYSLCQYGWNDVWEWGPEVGGNLWRTTGDISDSWKSLEEIGFDQGRLSAFVSPGHWNDPDMLEIGNGGMTAAEYQTHMNLWAMLAAPLLAGNDLRTMTAETRGLLTNTEVIAIDQDVLGRAATASFKKSGVEFWTRPLSNGDIAVAVFNRGDKAQNASAEWGQLGLSRPAGIRDLWQHQDRPAGSTLEAELPAHGSVMIRVRGTTERKTPTTQTMQ